MIKKIILIVGILILGIIIYNYFYVNNYNFKLNGNDTVTINIGDNYKGVSDYVNKINSNGGNAQLTQYRGSHDAPANAFFWILENKAQQGF